MKRFMRGGMTRRAVLGGTVALSGVLAACSGRQEGGGTSNEVAPAAKIRAGSTVVWWNTQAGNYPPLMQRWADQYAQKTGVKTEITAGMTEFETKFTAALAGGTPPDIFRYSPADLPLPDMFARNTLLKLDPYVRRDNFDLADFRKEAVALYRWKGNLYAIPRDYGLQLIFYNSDLFTREGLQPIPADWAEKTWTFEKFLDTGQRLARGANPYALFVPRSGRLLYSWIYSNGGAVVKTDKDGLATEIALAEKPAVDALQFVQDLMYKHKVAPLPGEESSIGNAQQLVATGKLGMQIANPGTNNQYRPSGATYDVGVFPLGKGARRGVGGGGTGWAITQATKVPDEAWGLVAHIASKQGQLDEVAIGQTTPSRVSVATGKEYLDPAQPPKNAKAFADGQDYVVKDPMHARWSEIERDVVAKTMTDLLWTGKATAQQVAAEIKAKADPLLKSG